jgi:hypothetical protein
MKPNKFLKTKEFVCRICHETYFAGEWEEDIDEEFCSYNCSLKYHVGRP